MGVVVDTAIRYAVMIGSNGEYSLCRAERCPPPGWRLEGTEGTRSECMACVQAHATAVICATDSADTTEAAEAPAGEPGESAHAQPPALPAGRRRSRPSSPIMTP